MHDVRKGGDRFSRGAGDLRRAYCRISGRASGFDIAWTDKDDIKAAATLAVKLMEMVGVERQRLAATGLDDGAVSAIFTNGATKGSPMTGIEMGGLAHGRGLNPDRDFSRRLCGVADIPQTSIGSFCYFHLHLSAILSASVICSGAIMAACKSRCPIAISRR